MADWTTVALAELAAPGKAAMATGPFGSAVSSKNFRDSGVPMLRGSNLSDNVATRLNETDLVYLDAELADGFVRSTAHRSDLVFTCWGTVGQIGFIDETAKYESYVVSNKQMKMTPDRQKVHPLFLYYLLSQPRMVDLVGSQAIGSSVPGFNLGQLKALQVTIPDLSTQRAIAEVLGALDDKIAANAEMADSCARLAEAHFTALRRSSEASLSPIGQLVDTQYGLTASACQGEGPRFVRVTDINKKPWVEWEGAPACEISESDWSKYQLNAGDILVARMADPGKAAFIDNGDPDAVFASYLVRLKAHDPTQALYIYCFLRSPEYWEYAEGAMTGSVQKNMNAKVIVACDISMPNGSDLGPFNRTVGALRASMRATLVESHRLAAMRDAVLPQLMSGKIRIKDAEQTVGDLV